MKHTTSIVHLGGTYEVHCGECMSIIANCSTYDLAQRASAYHTTVFNQTSMKAPLQGPGWARKKEAERIVQNFVWEGWLNQEFADKAN